MAQIENQKEGLDIGERSDLKGEGLKDGRTDGQEEGSKRGTNNGEFCQGFHVERETE